MLILSTIIQFVLLAVSAQRLAAQLVPPSDEHRWFSDAKNSREGGRLATSDM
jgi:hypothetical protein